MNEMHSFSKPHLVSAFDEWLRRYHEDPERYEAEYPADGEGYGDDCATYLLEVLLPETA